ncbi:MAG: 16S rRNA (cytosine(967)-C(5))-methyltransferase RsmB [Solobacterium sp.]|nr:16S rRNA (cytosine(967)-C(5))-methyltransferase RsmB [Solobacterium sp.]
MKSVRRTAWEYLDKIIEHGGYASLLMRKGQEGFSREDTALLSEIVYGTLRYLSLLEYQWQDLVKRTPSKKTAILLDISCYQLLFLDRIPDYAVIDEAVEMVSRNEKGFVNAVLRRVAERGIHYASGEDEVRNLAINTSHPEWLIRMWKAHYGWENTQKLCAFDLEPAVVYGRINTLKTTRERLQNNPWIHFLNDLSFTCDGNLVRTEMFRQGEIVIQDMCSAEIPLLLDAEKGMRVLDACSAPGTKAQEIAMLMENEGEILAGDLYPERVKLIDELMKRTGTSIVQAKVMDVSVLQEEYISSFDRILLDVPCSGLGDLRHKPEIKLHVTPESLDELISLQGKILETNSLYLRSGGILVYSTCTLNRKENEGMIKQFLNAHEEYELLEEKTVFPFERNTDGFYAAKLRKK